MADLGNLKQLIPAELLATLQTITGGTAVAPSARSLRYYFGAGNNGAGHVTAASVKVGDFVLMAIDLTTPADVTADFESVVTVAGQIQQPAAVDLHLKNLLILVQAES